MRQEEGLVGPLNVKLGLGRHRVCPWYQAHHKGQVLEQCYLIP